MTTKQTKTIKKATSSPAKRTARPEKIETRRDRASKATDGPIKQTWRQATVEEIADIKAAAALKRASTPRYTDVHLYLTGVSVAAGFLAVWVVALLIG